MSTLSKQIHYRQAFSEDSEILSKIHEECFPRYWDSKAFTNFFSIENTRAVLCEKRVGQQSVPVAMMVYRVVYESSDIITLAVCHPWRRQGIANELMGRAIAHARALGAKSMFLDVEEGNQPALALYESLGFRQINRRKDYYKQKDGSFTDALVMTCELA